MNTEMNEGKNESKKPNIEQGHINLEDCIWKKKWICFVFSKMKLLSVSGGMR